MANGHSSAVSSGTYTIGAQTSTTLSVNLSTVDNIAGIANPGTPVTNGGLDGTGHAYSAALLGSSLMWAGSTFTLGATGTSDAVSGAIIALPASNASTLNLLAAAVNGHQLNQTFVVTYTDGTSSSFTQSLSDWYAPQNYPGESQVSKMAYRLASSGAADLGPIYVYGYSFAINSAKTLKSLTLPNNRNVVVLAVGVLGATAGPRRPTRGESNPEPASRAIHLDPNRHARRHHAGRGDPLHDRWHHPLDEFRALQSRHAAAGGLQHHHRGDRGRERLQQ